MHNIIFPLKDTTLYTKYPEINTGLDEILEITKEVSSSNYFYRGVWDTSSFYSRYDYVSGSSGEYFFALAENVNQTTASSGYWESFTPTATPEYSRALIKFDLNNFEGEATASASAVYLNLFTAIARNIPIEYTLLAYPITGSWEMGVGNFTDKTTTGGATWNRIDTTTAWNSSGGDIMATYSSSQDFNFQPTDIRMDVTDIFNFWIASSSNDGFIIKRTNTAEQDTVKYGSLSFYSLDTHTVYVPTLEIVYDDHVYDTASFISSSTYQSASFSENTVTTESVAVIEDFKYYPTASVTESLVNINSSGSYPSNSLFYTTSSITGSEAVRDVNDDWLLSPIYIEYQSASVEYFNIGLQPLDTYDSASYNFISQSVKNDSLLYTTQSFTSSSIEYAPVSQSAEISSSLLSGSINISMKNFMPTYKYNTKTRFKINAKNSYVAKTFYEELRQGDIYYLPDSVYYSIRDAYTSRVMIPFSDYTKVSLNGTGHYFDVSLSGFMPERFYKIVFKVIIDGETQYIEPDSQFKVVK